MARVSGRLWIRHRFLCSLDLSLDTATSSKLIRARPFKDLSPVASKLSSTGSATNSPPRRSLRFDVMAPAQPGLHKIQRGADATVVHEANLQRLSPPSFVALFDTDGKTLVHRGSFGARARAAE